MPSGHTITITGAAEHNLRSVTVGIPSNRLVVVTGVSGSGKSSLIFDVLYREAEIRYLGSFSSYARQFMGRFRRPEVESVEGLSPAVSVDQKSVVSNPRSTVGTITGIYDALRLLFARTGRIAGGSDPFPVTRGLFSFNTQEGACPACKGLGVEDFLDPELLVADPGKTLRQGALVITAPNGYIIYSQVTLDVLDQVCRAEGFHIDIPWRELTAEQKRIILYGSEKIEIPYGKHPLESRMKWTGITAKPREMGYYKGILPVMETILKRDRNRNILRFVRTAPCRACGGTRLGPRARSVVVHGYDIAALAALQLDELGAILQGLPFSPAERVIAGPIVSGVRKQVGVLSALGLGYLSADRDSTTLSGGESQRLRLAAQAGIALSGLICIFDEPSAGMHPHDARQVIGVLKGIRDRGNTVIVVEHDDAFMRHADWLIDIGPGPGLHGGEVLYNGPAHPLPAIPAETLRRSRTLSMLLEGESDTAPRAVRDDGGWLTVKGASARNLCRIDVAFRLRALNVVTGVSGAGKSTLVHEVLGTGLEKKLEGQEGVPGGAAQIGGWEAIRKLISIDQSPIGRTPRSNPATYTGLFDPVRDLFARQEEAVSRGFGKGRFSFNTEGGRCESCEGAGYRQEGMHFLGTVEVPCETCEGRRFDRATLEVKVAGKSISEVLEMTVEEAIGFFTGEEKILRILHTLDSLGLGYLTLGQRSSTLSGGEAQRIKLATELARPAPGHTLYLLDEPTTGLHDADVQVLLQALERLVEQGHTVILVEHHHAVIRVADHVNDLGPGSGRHGGQLVYAGAPAGLEDCPGSLTGRALRERREALEPVAGAGPGKTEDLPGMPGSIRMEGVTTNNLQQVSLEIPHGKMTVVTGLSGSGKSSLAFDTLHAEGRNRFLESFSPYVRSRIGMQEQGTFEEISGLTPTFAVSQGGTQRNPRSTAGTMTGLYDHYRLLWSRFAENMDDPSAPRPWSSLFSFNHHAGACPGCDGLGFRMACDPEKLITDPGKPLGGGAMDGTKTGRFYGDPDGQYIATLLAAGERFGIDFRLPWNSLGEAARSLAMEGSGDEIYEVNWSYRRGERTGVHRFTGTWKGFAGLVEEEYARKHADHRGEGMMGLMMQVSCPACRGTRLRPEALAWTIDGLTIAEMAAMPVRHAMAWFIARDPEATPGTVGNHSRPVLEREILKRLEHLAEVGLGHLSADRPAATLSTGETRRIRLAAQLGSGLTGLTYILDELTVGLHPSETARLVRLIRSLQAAGNTVVVVEHDPQVILAADHVVEIGPGSGRNGGKVVAAGSPPEIMNDPRSVTGPYLRREMTAPGGTSPAGPSLEIPALPAEQAPGLSVRQVTAHHAPGYDLVLPAEGIIVVTGLSGSGKSSLLFDVIHASWLAGKPVGCSAISGFENYRRVIAVRHRGGVTSPVSTVATFAGLLDPVRDLFAAEPLAGAGGFGRQHFSYMDREGRCPACEGAGHTRVSMDFLPDLEPVCEACGGKRYREAILEIRVRGRNIAEVLEMTVSEALRFFEGCRNLTGRLETLERAGLGYLTPGQPVATLSGGEMQRLSLAVELMKPGTGRNLYILEEPSAGLHFKDVEHLAGIFRQLASQGHAILVNDNDPVIVEHANFRIVLEQVNL